MCFHEFIHSSSLYTFLVFIFVSYYPLYFCGNICNVSSFIYDFVFSIFFFLVNLAKSFSILCAQSLQSSLTFCDLIDHSPPGSSVHRILQAEILDWVAISSSGGSSPPRNWTHVSCITGRFFTTEPLGKLYICVCVCVCVCVYMHVYILYIYNV